MAKWCVRFPGSYDVEADNEEEAINEAIGQAVDFADAEEIGDEEDEDEER